MESLLLELRVEPGSPARYALISLAISIPECNEDGAILSPSGRIARNSEARVEFVRGAASHRQTGRAEHVGDAASRSCGGGTAKLGRGAVGVA
jgi:hypothetical protein